jgi:hypothetical protein
VTTRRTPAKRPSQTSKRHIPPHLERIALARLDEVNPETGRAHTAKAVSSWLLEAHQVSVSARSVLRLRAAVDAKGEALYVEALRAELRDAVAPAKASVERARRHLDALVSRSRSAKDVASALSALTRALDTFAKLGGVAAPSTLDVNLSASASIALQWPDEPHADNPHDHPPDAAPAST